MKGNIPLQMSIVCAPLDFLQEAQSLLSKMSVKVKKEPASPETWAE